MRQMLNILFADDDTKYSLIIKRFLENEGYTVTYFDNGLAAVEQFSVITPDLVLLDINMPGLNGFEVAAKIREQDQQTLIFFLTDRSDKNDRLKGFNLKGNDYLTKPFYPEELIARIKERFDNLPAEHAQDEIYHFGHTIFNYSNNELRTGNNKTLITSRQADILRLLVKNIQTTVARETILSSVWGADTYPNSLALNVQMTYLRRAIQNDAKLSIVSLNKKGYILKD